MALSARRSHRRRSPHGRIVSSLAAPMFTSIAVVALTLMLIGTDLVGNTLAFASINPTPTPSSRVIDGPFRPIEIPTEVPTRDLPVLGVPTETPATEEFVPTEEVIPTEETVPAEEPHRGTSNEGSITILKRSCPDATDVDLTFDELAETCQGPAGNVEFTLTDDSGAHTGVTGDDGSLIFDGVIAEFSGHVLLTETVPDSFGEPIVYCRVNLGDVQEPGPLTGIPVSDGGISLLPVTSPDSYTCFWYNIPTGGGGDVTIFKHSCPAGTAKIDDFYALGETCLEQIDPVEFTITATGGGYSETKTADPGVIQTAMFTDVPFGEIAIEESVPDGYSWPLVFCADTPSDGPGNYYPVDPSQESGSFIVDHRADAELPLTCLVFNFPSDEPMENSVMLWKFYCPPGTASNLSLADYEALCTDTFTTTFTLTDADGPQEQQTEANGYVHWVDVNTSLTNVSIQETLPSGYVDPQAWCALGNQQPEQVAMSDGFMDLSLPFDEFQLTCRVYNIPTPYPDNMIKVQKFFCPAGTSDALTNTEYVAICKEPLSPTTFTLTDPVGAFEKTTDVNGFAKWFDVSDTTGQVAIAEKLPVGYGTPQVFCTTDDGTPVEMPATNGYFKLSVPGGEFRILCEVFNIPSDLTSSLSIIKYTCPEGYDLYAPGANPGFDCQTLTDGIPFVLDDGMPGLDLGGITGDDAPGEVRFTDVKPGSYTVHELLSPDMGEPFVLKCEGTAPQLQPYPLWSGNDLPITLIPGNAAWCFWYNVPAPDPDLGTLTVTKYACTTKTFVSTADCQVFEGGQVIQLLEWDSTQWDMVDVEQTDAFGRIVWTNLPIGHYLLAEPDTTWCHIESSALLGNDGSFNINLQGGMDQTVDLYNCGFDPEIPEGTPTDWPNTGVGATYSSPQGETSDERRIPPVEGGEPATPASTRCLAADDPQATSGDAACPRGAVPSTIRIDAIGVDAPIEMKETVGGQMQQPTGETAVAWYKESSRLGESGNMLFAGHLNWWGVPEAVFFHLGDLQEGEEIVVTDASGAEWTYRVTWVRQDDTFAPPSADVVGPTDDPSITLITCGGDWNADTGLYDKRTVVRAELVSGPGMD